MTYFDYLKELSSNDIFGNTTKEDFKLYDTQENFDDYVQNHIQTNGYFAFDGDHKIYILEDSQDIYEAAQLDYEIRHIEDLKETYDNACPLKFINNWKLTKTYIEQFEGE